MPNPPVIKAAIPAKIPSLTPAAMIRAAPTTPATTKPIVPAFSEIALVILLPIHSSFLIAKAITLSWFD